MASTVRRGFQGISGAILVLVAAITVAAQLEKDESATVESTFAPIFREVNHQEHSNNHVREFEKSAGTNWDGDKMTEASGPLQATLMKELKLIQKSEGHKMGIFKVELRDDNIKEWNVKLFFKEGRLHEDLRDLKDMGKENYILLHISFRDRYPAEPPFVRIAYPILRGRSVGSNGVLCLDALTREHWNSSYKVETVIMAILSAFVEYNVRVSHT